MPPDPGRSLPHAYPMLRRHYSSQPAIVGMSMHWRNPGAWLGLVVLRIERQAKEHFPANPFHVGTSSPPFEFPAQHIEITFPKGSDQLDSLPGGPNLQLIATFQQQTHLTVHGCINALFTL